MENPYKATGISTSHRPRRRRLWPHMIASTLLLFVGLTISIPGLQLLNQQWGIFPTRTGIFDVEIDGQPVPHDTAIRYSVGAGGILWIMAIVLIVKLFLNWRHNRTVPTSVS